MDKRVIVSRHAAGVEFIAKHLLADEWTTGDTFAEIEPGFAVLKNRDTSEWVRIPVVEAATDSDVRGKIVYGNLPLHLAAMAEAVVAIEFRGNAPRGAEYSLTDMEAAGARLVRYCILLLPDNETRSHYLASGGFAL
jgi:hypothetical protein